MPGLECDFKGFWVILDFSCSLAGSMACFCLLGRAFARSSVEPHLNSSGLYGLLLLTLLASACFWLLGLAWAVLAACAFRSIVTQFSF